MADNNQNWRNQSHQSGDDWEQNRNRSNQENDNRNRENYSNYYSHAGYGFGRERSENEGYGSYNNDYENRVRYGNQHNDWRENQGRQNQGYGGNDWNQNRRNFGNSYNDDYNANSRQRNTGGSSSQYGRDNYGDSSSSGYRQNYGQDRYDASGGYYGNRGYRDQNYRGGRDQERDWWDRTKDEVSSWFGDEDAEKRRERDRMNASNYRGKGPKDYKRSEDRIREDVCDRLTDDHVLDATHIQIQIQGDEVVLTGTVDSREQKRRAEDIVESISGVKNVENRLRVNNANDRSYTGSLGTASEKVNLSKDNR